MPKVTIIIRALEKPAVFQDIGKGDQGAAPDIKPVNLPPNIDHCKFAPKLFVIHEE